MTSLRRSAESFSPNAHLTQVLTTPRKWQYSGGTGFFHTVAFWLTDWGQEEMGKPAQETLHSLPPLTEGWEWVSGSCLHTHSLPKEASTGRRDQRGRH